MKIIVFLAHFAHTDGPCPSTITPGKSCLLQWILSLTQQDHVPSKHKTFVEHLYNVGPTSKTLGQHRTNVIQMFCVC